VQFALSRALSRSLELRTVQNRTLKAIDHHMHSASISRIWLGLPALRLVNQSPKQKRSKAALSIPNTTQRCRHHTMLPVLPTAVLLLIIAKLAWSDQAALSLTSRDTYQSLRPFVCAHTSRLRSMLRNWTSRSLPPASQAVSWPVALQSARCMDTDEAVPSFIIAVAPLLTVHMGHPYNPDQLAGQLALKVHRALQKCPFLRNIYIQAFARVVSVLLPSGTPFCQG